MTSPRLTYRGPTESAKSETDLSQKNRKSPSGATYKGMLFSWRIMHQAARAEAISLFPESFQSA
jgi:hypothetical protein